jgi:endonuclease I
MLLVASSRMVYAQDTTTAPVVSVDTTVPATSTLTLAPASTSVPMSTTTTAPVSTGTTSPTTTPVSTTTSTTTAPVTTSATTAPVTTTSSDSPPYSNCNVTDYYADLISQYGTDATAWPREALRDWIVQTHRNTLPNTAPVRGGDDILMALIDLDPGDVPGTTVHLIYRDISFPALPAGNPNTWEREDLWPLDRGIPRNSSGLTDVHSKRPADSTVLLKKDALFFGTCGTVESDSSCSRPATTETAPDTEQDNKIFAPPEDARGDIARSLFYTALRYETAFELELTDCPPFGPSQFGYLSPLLEWTESDPVSEQEVQRNDRACQRWQGNRNPFVDFPELVPLYFGTPAPIETGKFTYQGCTLPTNSPTATPNDCSALQAGDVPVFVLNSDAPDQVVLFPLAEIPPSVGSIYITDNAWNGTHFIETEGVVEVRIYM